MRKIFAIILISFTFMFCVTKVSASSNAIASVVACKYGFGDINTKPLGEYVTSRLSTSLNFHTVYNTYSPTKSILKGETTIDRYFLESDVLYLAGHATKSNIAWEGCTIPKVGIRAFDTDYSSTEDGYLVGVGQYDLSRVKFVMLEGCDTAKGTSNISKFFVTKGATTSLGWSTEINTFSAKSWLTRFWDKVSSGGTIQEANNYANSATYIASSIKNTVIYGNKNLKLSTLKTLAVNNLSSPRYGSAKLENEYNFMKKVNSNDIIEKISYLIKENINSNFNIKNFEITTSYSDGKKIVDLIYNIDGVVVELGYTIFIQNNYITSIFDNTNEVNLNDLGKEIKELKISKNSTNTKNKIVYDYLTKELYKFTEQTSIDSYGAIQKGYSIEKIA